MTGKEHRKWPLKRIVELAEVVERYKERNGDYRLWRNVELECGHIVTGWGGMKGRRRRCRACFIPT